MIRRARWWLCVFSTAAACGGGSDEPIKHAGSAAANLDESDGLVLRLSDGARGAPAYDHARLAPAQKLGDAEVAALLARVKPLATGAADHQAVALRPASQPPPQTGETVSSAFPPPVSSAAPRASDPHDPLHVTRWTPEGKLPNVPQLTVTFDQPMIAVSSQAAAASSVPVKLSPQPKGTWRWIGTRTIVFDPEGGAFPRATTYTVNVP